MNKWIGAQNFFERRACSACANWNLRRTQGHQHCVNGQICQFSAIQEECPFPYKRSKAVVSLGSGF